MALLPHKRTRELNKSLDILLSTQTLALRIKNIVTGESMIVGGEWSQIDFDYSPLLEASKKHVKTVKVHDKQWKLLLAVIDALGNDDRETALQDILFHGARRVGKSQGVAIAAALILIAKPASKILAIGRLKEHGQRIIGLIKTYLDPSLWTWDDRESELRLANHSTIRTRSAAHYDDLRGGRFNAILWDEAAFLPFEAYEALSPSLIDLNGINCFLTSPNGHNWIYERYKRAEAKEKEKRESIRVLGASIRDNAFLSQAAIRRSIENAQTLSKNAYLQEIEGKFLPSAGLAFEDFNKDMNIASIENLAVWGFEEITKYIGRELFGIETEILIGLDFNYKPNSAAFVKVADNGAVWAFDEIQIEGTPDKFCDALYSKIEAMGLEPLMQVALIVDASSYWQGTGKDVRKSEAITPFLDKGFKVFTPMKGKKYNPPREDRYNVVSSLVQTVSGEIRLFVDPKCETMAKMFQEIPQKNGTPDFKSPLGHIYDALGYVIYRLFNRETFNAVTKRYLKAA